MRRLHGSRRRRLTRGLLFQHRPTVELLEDRTLLSIVWANRGQSGDRFDELFGSKASAARQVVDAVIDAWNATIINFNYSDGTTDLLVNISMNSEGSGTGGSATTNLMVAGKPKVSTITLNRGTDTNGDGKGDGAGWFIDPTPGESSEFVGDITNAFAGNAQSDSPAVGLSDLYTVVVSEMNHAVGMTNGFNLLQQSGFLTDTGVPDTSEGGSVGNFYVFRGPSVEHLMTSNNGGAGGQDFHAAIHSAGPGVSVPFGGKTFIGADDAGNAIFEGGRRYLVPDTMALMLRDAYGYQIALPSNRSALFQDSTFYAVLDRNSNSPTFGQLLVRGATGSGSSNDRIEITNNGSFLTVGVDIGNDVPGTGRAAGASNLGPFTALFNAADIRSIKILGGDGNDQIIINNNPDTFGTRPIKIDGGDGNDTITLAGGGQTLDDMDSAITINDTDGSDRLIIDDSAKTANGLVYSVSNTSDGFVSFKRINSPTFLIQGMDQIEVRTGAGDDNINVASLFGNIKLSINSGGGNDLLQLGFTYSTPAPGSLLTNAVLEYIDGPVSFDGGDGIDSMRAVDTGNGASEDYLIDAAGVTRNRVGVFSYANTVENVALLAGVGASTFFVNYLPQITGGTFTLQAGGGNDILALGGTTGLTFIRTKLTFDGQDGVNQIIVDDRSTSFDTTFDLTQNGLNRSIQMQPMTFANVSNVVVNAGSGTNKFNMEGIGAFDLAINAGSGNSTINVTPTLKNLDQLRGTLRLDGEIGNDVLVFDDSLSTLAHTYAMGATSLIRTGNGDNGFPRNWTNLDSVTLRAGAAADTINLTATAAGTPVVIDSGAGNDIVNVTGTVILDSLTGATRFAINSAVTINGGLGTDSLNVNGASSSAGISSTVTTRTITGFSAAGTNVTYDGFENLLAATGVGVDRVLVASTLQGVATTIDLGDGKNAASVGGDSTQPGDARAVQGNVLVRGGKGSDQLRLDDRLDLENRTVTVTSSQVTGLTKGSTVSFTGIEGLSIFCGSGNDTIFNQVPASSSLAVFIDEGGGEGGIAFYGTNKSDDILISRLVTSDGAQLRIVMNGETYITGYAHGETVIVFAGQGNDRVTFDSSAAVTWRAELHGEQGKDWLYGSTSNDTLIGGQGIDQLFGGGGVDTLIEGTQKKKKRP